MAITVTDIKTEYGAYYEAGGQNEKDLLGVFKEVSDTEALFPEGIATVGPNQSDKVKKATFETTRVLQPFQKAFTPIGDVTFKPTEIDLFRLKIDTKFTPDDLQYSWLGFLKANNLDRTTWPFVRWIVEKFFVAQHKQDREMNEIFKGVYAAPTAGTAGAVSSAMNGIRKIIRTKYAAGNTGVLALGAIPSAADDFCTYVEDFVKGLPELVKTLGGTIVMSRSLRNLYREGKRAKYNQYWAQAESLDTVTDWENFVVKGVASHTGSDLIWYSPEFNKNRFMVAGENESLFKIGEYTPREVSIFTDYYYGVGFWIDEYLFHNDQDLV